MDTAQKTYVADIIDCEGFEYAFVHYSNFDDVKDEEFHKLRLAFIEARKKLQEYIEHNEEEE